MVDLDTKLKISQTWAFCAICYNMRVQSTIGVYYEYLYIFWYIHTNILYLLIFMIIIHHMLMLVIGVFSYIQSFVGEFAHIFPTKSLHTQT